MINMKRGWLILLILTLFIASGCAQTPTPPLDTTPPAAENTIIVASTTDSGPGTLRQALLDAQSGDTIIFDPAVFPPSVPATIYLLNSLPLISQGNLKIDASNAGVILDGGNILNTSGNWISGLEIRSNGNIIQGLQIVNFSPAVGITLAGGAQNNTIGGDRSVGSGPLGQGNLVSKVNTGIALFDDGTSFNTVTGNLIGTDPTGTDAWGNDGTGVHILEGASHNIIGPDNIIAYNDTYGIGIQGLNSLGNTITQNSIHDNKVQAIHLWGGGNTELSAPVILDFDLDNGTVTGFDFADCTVEIFSDSSNEGEVYEGQTITDSSGFFAFNKGTSLAGPSLTAIATDADGNTSGFSIATSGTYGSTSLQENNTLPRTRIQTKESGQLEDNRIGVFTSSLWHLQPEVFPEGILDASDILQQGFKRFRFGISNLESDNPYVPIEWDKPELSIDPSHDEFITSLADNGITMTYVLSFWDKAYVAEGSEIPIPRFKTEDEIQRYLDFVRFIVQHFKDRIEYYEIWNEPDRREIIQWIEVEDYINLVRRVVPVIREEYPEAKIVIGGTAGLMNEEARDYLFTILRSDIMPLVDVVSWHGMYGTSPEYDSSREYYYEYPSIVQEIKDVASAHGFTGEYVDDEIHWQTPDQSAGGWPTYSEIKSAKYLMRGTVMDLGMDITVSQITLWGKPQLFRTNQNLCTVMAGTEPANLPIKIQIEATNIRSYTFSLPNGDQLIALWIDGEAVDSYPGINTTVSIPGFSTQKVVGIDVLYGFEQELITSIEDGSTVINNLLVKDYPIILRLGD